MLYVIGIDSGATSSDVVLFPLEYGKAKEVRKKYEPINISILGIIESARRLVDIIKDISKKTGLSNITAVAAGISGARYEKDRRYLSAIIKKRCGIKNVSVYPDTEIAFASAFENDRKTLEEIKMALAEEQKKHSDWIDIHRVRYWKSGDKYMVDMHLIVPHKLTISESHETLEIMEGILRKLLHTTKVELFIHFDPDNLVKNKYF